VTQVALVCDFAAPDTVYLNVYAPDVWPRLVFTANVVPAGNSSTGSLYLLAAGTTVAKPDFEETVFFVRGDQQVNRLLYEAPLGR
jgi:hypothetical protein